MQAVSQTADKNDAGGAAFNLVLVKYLPYDNEPEHLCVFCHWLGAYHPNQKKPCL